MYSPVAQCRANANAMDAESRMTEEVSRSVGLEHDCVPVTLRTTLGMRIGIERLPGIHKSLYSNLSIHIAPSKNKTTKGDQVDTNQKEEAKLSLFADDMIVYISNPKKIYQRTSTTHKHFH